MLLKFKEILRKKLRSNNIHEYYGPDTAKDLVYNKSRM